MPEIYINRPVGAGGEAPLGGWAPYVEPTPVPPPQEGPDTGASLGGWVPYTGPPAPSAAQPMGAVEAGGLGALHGASFGTYPMLHGAAEASGMPQPTVESSATGAPLADQGDPLGALRYLGTTVARPFVGAYNLLTGAPGSTDAYTKGREEALKAEEQARRDQPAAFLTGTAAGGLAITPALGPLGTLKAATGLGRIAQGTKVGAVTGAAYGAGEAGSRGESPLQTAAEAGKGAVVGGVLGGVLGTGIEAATSGASRLTGLLRGHRDPELEAAQQVAQAYTQGAPARRRIDPAMIRVGQQAQVPLMNVDVMGAPGRRLLRKATNLSPEGQDIAGEAIFPRFAAQGEQAGDWFLHRFGGGDIGATLEQIRSGARLINGPMYRRAEQVAERMFPRGIGPDQSPEIERLLSSKDVREAIAEAIERGSTRDVAAGLGGMNRTMVVDPRTGMLTSTGVRGPVAGFPDLRLWDYTQRILGDKAQALQNKGELSQAAALFQIKGDLVRELDRLVPPFGQARGIAARFFGASDAVEAGEQFVGAGRLGDKSLRDPDVARLVASMSPAERDLFRYGFVTELVRKLGAVGDNRAIVNQIANTPNARQRIAIALGPGALDEVLALTRIMGLTDRARTAAFGNSTTAQQVSDIVSGGTAGAVAGGGLTGILGGALLYAARQFHSTANEQVMTHVARMLVSDDPAVYQRGVAIAARNPVVREALRRASDLSTRELISALGPAGAGAAAVAVGKRALSSSPKVEPDHREHRQEQDSGP